ncbi:MAG: hypothetical protein Q6K80_09620, partial [Thermostichus sp. DG_1_6_bins_120]
MNPSTQPLRICLLQAWDPAGGELLAWELLLPAEHFETAIFRDPELFLEHLHRQDGNIDCLLLLVDPVRMDQLEYIGNQLCQWGLLLPTVLALISEPSGSEPAPEEPCSAREPAPASETSSYAAALLKREQFFYHNATLVRCLPPSALLKDTHCNGISTLELLIKRAIALFLQISPTCGLPQGQVRPKGQAYLT